MSEQATTQQDTREQQVEAVARVLHKPSPADATQIGGSWRRSESLRNAAALLDGPVARMIADAEQAAERRGAERMVALVQSMATGFRALADPDGHRALLDVLALAEREGLL